jgi:HTH-type transcriptional regulator/antitoxin HigA
MTSTYHSPVVSPPGGTIADLMEEREDNPSEIALALGLAPEALEELLSGRFPIDEGLASKLDAVFGAGSDYWIAHERAYRRWLDEPSRLAV